MRAVSSSCIHNTNILLDAHMLGEQEGGNETYVAGLIEGFSRLQLPESYRITVLHGSHYQPLAAEHKTHLQYRQILNGNSWKRLFHTIPALCRESRADLVHITYNASPFMRYPLVVTVHDVIFRIYPEFFSPRVRLLLSTLMPLTMWKAKSIITISKSSQNDIERLYPSAKGKIRITPLAPGSIVNAMPNYVVSERLTQEQDFILCVGTVQPRKNIERLVEAYVAARRSGTVTAKLLIVGRAAWQHSKIHQIASSSGFKQDIVFTGYLSDDVLSALYRRCLVFVYPSLYEGFGIPVIEAMACGAPVITSNCSSLPEVAGDAAIKINPHSVNEIQSAIEQVTSNDELRRDLLQRGMRRAQMFSWAQTAAETYQIYQESVR